MSLTSFLGCFLAHRLIVLHIKQKYALNPSHSDVLILISGLAPGSLRINGKVLKGYSTGKTSYSITVWIADLLAKGYIHDIGPMNKKGRIYNNYRLTESGQAIVDYIYSALRERVKYTNDKMKIAEGLKSNRSKEQTKRKTAAARLRREKARLLKLNPLDIPPVTE